MSHEYLIEQLQFTGAETINSSGAATTPRIKLNFNHPCKELIWVVQRDSVTSDSNAWTDFTDSNEKNMTDSAKIQLNGHDRMAARSGAYFSLKKITGRKVPCQSQVRKWDWTQTISWCAHHIPQALVRVP